MIESKQGNKKLWKKIEDFFYSDSLPVMATKTLLMSLAVGSFAFGGAVVPGILKIMENNFGFSGKTKKYSKKQISNSLAYLKRKKLIKIIKSEKGKTVVKLSNQGKKRILKLSLSRIKIKKPNKWDGKWRIVIFDIPVKFNVAREALREKIKKFGFRQLQKSVWIFPYKCEDEILFVSEMFRVEEYVEIIIAERILHESELRKTFKV